jgi:hypothetical protein
MCLHEHYRGNLLSEWAWSTNSYLWFPLDAGRARSRRLSVEEGGTLEEALPSYEREMLQRSRNYVLLSRNAAREMHSRNWWVQCKLKAKLRIANFFIKRRRRSGR